MKKINIEILTKAEKARDSYKSIDSYKARDSNKAREKTLTKLVIDTFTKQEMLSKLEKSL